MMEDEMIELRESQLIQPTNADTPEFADSSESMHAPNALSDDQIVEHVLGTRSRYKKGKGSLPRLKNIGGTRAPSSGNVGSAALAKKRAETITALERQLAEQAEQQNERIPNFNFQPPLPPSLSRDLPSNT